MIRLCATADVAPNQPLRVVVAGLAPLAVYKAGEDFYVTDDTCTHGQASLSEDGELVGFTIVCSWHDGAFDIRTGEAVTRPCTEPLRVYPVSICEGAVFIDI